METIKTIYRIGHGPSSSHTMAPERACQIVLKKYPEATKFNVTLYNSLASTGQGHLTNYIIQETLGKARTKITKVQNYDKHPNYFTIRVLKGDTVLDEIAFASIGGGALSVNGKSDNSKNIYKEKSFDDIKKYIKEKHITLTDYVFEHEDEDFKDYLLKVWEAMKKSITRGLMEEGILPGKLGVVRKAKELFKVANLKTNDNFIRKVSSYAFAVGEENAAGNVIATAPTCGACGVVPAVLYYYYHDQGMNEEKIIHALAVAGLFGNIVRKNATISGAVGGCQAEVGTACSMAAAACSFLFNSTVDEIEYAAEIGMEHHLGLTCDPVDGYVQIPCIERNAVAAIRAINASMLADSLSGTRKVSFDTVVKTMYQTGLDMDVKYKETAEAGLAYFYYEKKGKQKK